MYLLVDFMKLVAESFSLTLKLSNFDFTCLWNVLLFLHFLGFVFCIHSCILVFNYGNFIIFIFYFCVRQVTEHMGIDFHDW